MREAQKPKFVSFVSFKASAGTVWNKEPQGNQNQGANANRLNHREAKPIS